MARSPAMVRFRAACSCLKTCKRHAKTKTNADFCFRYDARRSCVAYLLTAIATRKISDLALPTASLLVVFVGSIENLWSSPWSNRTSPRSRNWAQRRYAVTKRPESASRVAQTVTVSAWNCQPRRLPLERLSVRNASAAFLSSVSFGKQALEGCTITMLSGVVQLPHAVLIWARQSLSMS
ncbi:hypothetical protein B0J14DRAFT_314935 [Halenospora varia]|nr:hypothetical protein B0J14DRAFT_314935 [Halenospora varia]